MRTSLAARLMFGVHLALVALTTQAQGSGCGCFDARDLFSRYCSSRGAVQEWDRLIYSVRQQERAKQAVIPAFDMKVTLAKCVEEVINMYRQEGPGSRSSSGETAPDCSVTIDAPNACMRGVIEHHEAWHKKVCEAHYRPDAAWRSTLNPFTYLTSMINRMSQQSAVDYMYEERTGYMLEIGYLRDRLEELASRCNEAKVFRPTSQGRSFSLQQCPRPNEQDYVRKCPVK